jgi:diadenosine tetraphosphatase ApaH/serine/threonine PP2A family protein phosphatase
MDCYTLHLEGFDIILGVQWLQSLRPIIWDFNALSMAFGREGCSIRFIGCEGTPCTLYSVQPIDNILEALFIAYSDIFEEPRGLPPQHHRDHRIHLLLGTTPVAVRPYRYSQLLKDEVERQCTNMLAQGIIRPSTSPFSSPVLLVKKSDGSWHFCVDYGALNDKTIKDEFPIPVIDELLDELQGARYFTKIDLCSGYHQVRMHPEDIEKLAFRTHQGLFEFTVMPFGLTNTPATFQSLMNVILQPYIRKFILVFFDDILIYSLTWAEHMQHVKLVFEQRRAHRLYIKKSKCVFGGMLVAYIGHIILAEGVAMDPEKVSAVKAWPKPWTVRALRGFLGLMGYYRKFID